MIWSSTGDSIFSFAESRCVSVLGHSSEDSCIPEVYAAFAERYPAVPIIAAHLGSVSDEHPAHHIRVDLVELSYEEKYRILRGNAFRLFGSRLCRGEDGKEVSIK